MTWYIHTLTKYRKEIISSAIVSVLFSVTILLWHFGLGKSFVWKNIEPISAPGLLERGFYSAITYLTIGAFLYWVRFHQFLHGIVVGIFDDWRLYKDIKGFIWGGLILVSYFWVIPRIVDFLNAIISFFYNVLGLILYSLPSLGIALVLSIPILVFIWKSTR